MVPKDPYILLSYVNTQLRDHFPSLERLCDNLDESVEEITSILEAAGFRYDAGTNQFR